MKQKITEAVIFAVVLPTLFGILGAVGEAQIVVTSSIAMGIYAAIIYAIDIIRELY